MLRHLLSSVRHHWLTERLVILFWCAVLLAGAPFYVYFIWLSLDHLYRGHARGLDAGVRIANEARTKYEPGPNPARVESRRPRWDPAKSLLTVDYGALWEKRHPRAATPSRRERQYEALWLRNRLPEPFAAAGAVGAAAAGPGPLTTRAVADNGGRGYSSGLHIPPGRWGFDRCDPGVFPGDAMGSHGGRRTVGIQTFGAAKVLRAAFELFVDDIADAAIKRESYSVGFYAPLYGPLPYAKMRYPVVRHGRPDWGTAVLRLVLPDTPADVVALAFAGEQDIDEIDVLLRRDLDPDGSVLVVTVREPPAD